MVFNPSLPPNHSNTTRILPEVLCAATWLALLKTYGTGPRPPKRPNPRPPVPIRSMSRRETPLSDNFLLAIALCLSDEPTAEPGGKPGHYRRAEQRYIANLGST